VKKMKARVSESERASWIEGGR